jgi:hypothetical protein
VLEGWLLRHGERVLASEEGEEELASVSVLPSLEVVLEVVLQLELGLE